MSHSETQAGAPPLLSSPSIPPSPAPGSMAAAAATPYWRSFSLLTRSLSLGDLYEHDGLGGEQRMEDGHEMWNKKEWRGRARGLPVSSIQEEYENPCALWYFSTSWAAPT